MCIIIMVVYYSIRIAFCAGFANSRRAHFVRSERNLSLPTTIVLVYLQIIMLQTKNTKTNIKNKIISNNVAKLSSFGKCRAAEKYRTNYMQQAE